MSDVVAVAAGDNHALALKADGTVWAWGANESGQSGDGTTLNHTSPIRVTDLENVTAIVAGCNHSLALLADKSVKAWGVNAYGQLGDATTTSHTTPTPVIGTGGAAMTRTTYINARAVGVTKSLKLTVTP
ncbi:MAG: hypothetical protein MSG64_12995 [Pyrinomonadaceae bacterium MAG19_C2-C3]|nr:hypothetical protein [Pyrinomonadaceae bacterium MAG19_C2-C3]